MDSKGVGVLEIAAGAIALAKRFSGRVDFLRAACMAIDSVHMYLEFLMTTK